MARKKENVETLVKDEKVFIVRATKRLTESEHKQLSDKLRFESEKSGLNFVLMPSICELVQNEE